MGCKMLDYRIKTFLTLYKVMNYRITAQLLNMTQPGVTQHIHFIENYYGVKLFEYNGKTLSRTPAAESLKKHIESITAEEQEIFNSLKKQDKIHLDVGATKTIGEFVITPQVREFLKDNSHSINLDIDNTENLLSKLENCELDFAVIEGVFDKTRYKYKLFKTENFVGICSKNHPFANKTVMLADTMKETLILREYGSGTRLLLEQAINSLGWGIESYKRCISVSNFSVISEMVALDNAITFAYEPVALSNSMLTTFSVEDIHIVGEFNFVYCNEKIANDKIKLLFPTI